MPYNTFDPVPAPSPGTSDAPKLKILEAEFGDGYSQSIPDGINHIRRNVDLSWDLLTPDQADAIADFFVAQGGTEPFYYTPSDELTALKWTCKEWSVKRGDGGMRSVSAKLVQSFLL